MANTPQPPVDQSITPISNSKTSILQRPQYTSWMKSQSVNRQEETQQQNKADNEKKQSSGIAQQRVKLVGGIPVSENTGLYVALSPEAQKSLLEKEQLHKKVSDEDLTGISVATTKKTDQQLSNIFEANNKSDIKNNIKSDIKNNLNEEPLINPFLPTNEEVLLNQEVQNKQKEISTQVEVSSTIRQEIKNNDNKVTSIFDIEIQAAMNQIERSQSGEMGEDSYNENFNDDNNYTSQISEEFEADISEEDVYLEEENRDYQGLTVEDRKEVDRLKKRDAEVRAHEMAHLAAAGGLATGPYYEYQQGPDSKQYVVGGHVNIDTSPGNTPEETLMKDTKIRAAAMAPIEPSSQDRIVAAEAARMEANARANLAAEKANQQETQDSDIQDSDIQDVEANNIGQQEQGSSSYFNPDTPMFSPIVQDTSHISSTASTISVIPRKSTAEIYASGFSNIHPVEQVDETTSSIYRTKSEHMNVDERVEQTRVIKGIAGYNRAQQEPEELGAQSTKRYQV